MPSRVASLGATVWKRLGGRLQWRILWLRHHTFMVGLTVAAWDKDGRVLVLEHAFWKGSPWGLPSGYLERGETFEEGIAREVREETSLELADVRVERVRAGFDLRLEVLLSGVIAGGEIAVDGREVTAARLVLPSDLPAVMRRSHQELIDLGPRVPAQL